MLFALALALAQVTTPQQQVIQEPGSNLTVYLVTIGQGHDIYERFGHNQIWIHDPDRGTDFAYNWGVFDFGTSVTGFVWRFTKGDLRYMLAVYPEDATIEHYKEHNRTVWAQELHMTPAQKRELQRFVEWNALPENVVYSYDYYRDNCSTRARDALDRALGGALKRALLGKPGGLNYRQQTRRLMVGQGFVLAGMNLAMGAVLDQPIDRWAETFIPMELQEAIRDVKVNDANGQPVPLVKSERVLFQSTRPAPPEVAANPLPRYLLIGLAIAALLLIFGSLRARWAGIVFRLLAVTWTLLVGLLGTVILFLWLFTDHYVTYSNENVLQANPLALVLCVGLIILWFGSRRSWKLVQRTSVVVAGLAMLGFILQVSPGLDQTNGEIIALLLPAHAALAWVIILGRAFPLPKTAV